MGTHNTCTSPSPVTCRVIVLPSRYCRLKPRVVFSEMMPCRHPHCFIFFVSPLVLSPPPDPSASSLFIDTAISVALLHTFLSFVALSYFPYLLLLLYPGVRWRDSLPHRVPLLSPTPMSFLSLHSIVPWLFPLPFLLCPYGSHMACCLFL